jgi:GntR family transcriptional regulator
MKRRTWHDLAEEIAGHIEDGRFAPNQKLPTVIELAQEYDIGHNSVTKAIQDLKRRGFLKGVKGGPTTVRVRAAPFLRSNVMYQEGKDLVVAPELVRSRIGISEKTTGLAPAELFESSVKFTVMQADGQVAADLGIPEATHVLHRRYVRQHVEGAGKSKLDSYIPYDLVKDFPPLLDANREPWPGGTFHQLYTAGIEVDEVIDTITSRNPSSDEALEYDVPEGIPLIIIRKTTYDTQGRAVEVAYIPSPADRVTLEYRTPLKRWNSAEN